MKKKNNRKLKIRLPKYPHGGIHYEDDNSMEERASSSGIQYGQDSRAATVETDQRGQAHQDNGASTGQAGGAPNVAGTIVAADTLATDVVSGTKAAASLNDDSNKAYRKADNADIGGQLAAAGKGTISGAAAGATVGAAFAAPTAGLSIPIGAVIGGAIGGTSAFFKQRATDKQEWRDELSNDAQNQQIAAANAQQQQAYQNQQNIKQFQARDGGQMPFKKLYAEGGMNMQPNAQLESVDGVGESYQTPDGNISHVPDNTGTHEEQANQMNPMGNVNIDPGTMILSSSKRLKLPSTGKSASESFKPIQRLIDKQKKGIELTKGEEKSLEMAPYAFNKFYNETEALKLAKVNNYKKRLGGVQKLVNGGLKDNLGASSNLYPGGGLVVDPNYNAWSAKNQLNHYQGLSDQPNMMYNPANYKYDYYNPKQNYIQQPFVQPVPGNKGIDFNNSQSGPFNRNTNGYVNSNFTFGEGGRKQYDWNGNQSSYKENGIPDNTQYQRWGQDLSDQDKANIDARDNPSTDNSYSQDKINSNYTSGLRPQVVEDYQPTLPKKGVQYTRHNQPTNWKDMAYQGAGTLAQSAGQLMYLKEQGKKYDTQQFYQNNPRYVDYSSDRRDAQLENNAARYAMQNASNGNSGAYLANIGNQYGRNSLNLSRINQAQDNQNAQIANRSQEYNIRNRYMTDDINARNKAAVQNAYYNAIGSVGTNVASGMRDYRADKYDQGKVNMLPEMINDPQYRKWLEQSQFYSNQGRRYQG